MACAMLLASFLLLGGALAGPYTPDLYWPNPLPSGTSSFTAIAIDTLRSEVYVAQRGGNYSNPILVLDKEGNLLRSWGNDTISFGGTWGVHGLSFAAINGSGFVFVADIGDHSVKKFDYSGKLLAKFGTAGTAGSGVNPLQFGNVADVAASGSLLFFADGDGGVNNRVDAVDATGRVRYVIGRPAPGAATGQFNSPHSVAYYAPSSLLFVADRGNNRTQAFAGASGKFLGEWTCTRPGTPWGVRSWDDQNLLFVADGSNHVIYILDLSAATPTSPGACSVLASVAVDPTVCDTPHEIDIDPANGELYVACLGTPSRVMRFHSECASAACWDRLRRV